ncbi:MAG: FAD-dependent oxidoreductase [Treponema sp.]|nr:FAD-dependent oxidoreductase [Treponema sp.]
MKVGIIGAGPAGLTCAVKLAEQGVDVSIYESDKTVGGMTKSFDLWGQKVDLGPHRFFSMDQRINDFWLSYVGEDYIMVDRLTRIFYKHKFFLYPVRAFNALANLGVWEAFLCILSYFRAQFKKKGSEKSFEEWVSNRFGYRLYSIFFKSYSERLWGIPCTELDADFARQRIKGLNMLEVIKSALFHQGGSKHKTLVDRFAYPKFGAGVPYENIAKKITELGGHIYLETPVKGIKTEGGKACGIVFADGKEEKFDFVVSTAPFTEMLCSIPDFSDEVRSLAQSLTYRNTTLVYLEVTNPDIFKDNWIYVHDKTVTMGRITNFRNWSPFMLNGKESTILALEYWSYDNDEQWQYSDAQMVDLAKSDIVKAGLAKTEEIKDGYVVRMHRSYPVYDTGYQQKMVKLQAAADSIGNMLFIGRNGSFKYNNQDHSILMGLLAAENILSGTNKNNLWLVNTDYDYQEAGKSLEKK